MARGSRTPLTLIAALVSGACGGLTPFGPTPTEDISVELAVTGGLAGVDYAFEVDGERGQVRGVRCVSFCDFNADEMIVALSDEQVRDLARRLDDAGVRDLGSRDLGSGCCDFFHMTLTYVLGGETVVLSGTQDRFSEALGEAISYLLPLARGQVPVIVSPDTDPTDWPDDPLELGDIEVVGLLLTAEVSYGGGCEPHGIDLVAWGGWMESSPVRINTILTHDGRGDACEAYLTETRSFDLAPLARAYYAAYGQPDGPETVILLLANPGGEPAVIEVEVGI